MSRSGGDAAGQKTAGSTAGSALPQTEAASGAAGTNSASGSRGAQRAQGTSGAQGAHGGKGLERSLTSRHIQFIALGGCIGTGLFLGSGKSISQGGPSVILQYLLIGLVMFLFMRAIGEMLWMDPDQHTFISFIGRYLGPGWGRFSTWSYWIVLLLIGMTQLTAVSQYFVQFFALFGMDISRWGWLIQIVTLALLLAVNLISAEVFGETEFWFSLIKILLIIGIIVTGAVMVITGFQYPSVSVGGVRSPAGKASLSNLAIGGFSLAPSGMGAFLSGLQMVFFAYTLLELIGVTISETSEPRTVIPGAINQLMRRSILLYVLSLTAIMAIVPWTSFKPGPDGSYASPFVMVFEFAGIRWASALVFFVVITAAASSLSSLLYSSGRQLYQAALDSDSRLLRPMRRVSRTSVPSAAIIFSALVILVVPMIGLLPGVSDLFTLFSATASAVLLFVYMLTMAAHWKYRSSADFRPDGFVLRGYRVWDVVVIALFVFVYVAMFADRSTLLPAVLGLAWLVVFGLVCRHLGRKDEERQAREALVHEQFRQDLHASAEQASDAGKTASAGTNAAGTNATQAADNGRAEEEK